MTGDLKSHSLWEKRVFQLSKREQFAYAVTVQSSSSGKYFRIIGEQRAHVSLNGKAGDVATHSRVEPQ
jgi:hypothetical protein